jgi:hypothetical protein
MAVQFDAKAYKRINRAYIWHFWDRWLRWAAGYGVVVGASSLLARVFTSPDPRSTWVNTLIVGFGIGFVLTWIYGFYAIYKNALKDAGDLDTFSMDGEGFAWLFETGVRWSIPWHAAKIEFSHRDGWILKAGDRRILVYRKPLEEVGAVEEFLERLSASKLARHQAVS